VDDIRSTGTKATPFFPGIPGSLKDIDDIDVGSRLRGTNCFEKVECATGVAADGTPRPKHAPER